MPRARRARQRLANAAWSGQDGVVTHFVALLRAVNVGGRKVPMADLRALAGEIGLAKPTTFIASGNLLFDAEAADADLEAKIEAALEQRFGFQVPVIVRSAEQWRALIAVNPLAQASVERPNLVLMGLSKHPLHESAAHAIQNKGTLGEKVVAAGGALWFDYRVGVGNSKLTPALIDRAAGSPVTGRNWRTVLKLGELLEL